MPHEERPVQRSDENDDEFAVRLAVWRTAHDDDGDDDGGSWDLKEVEDRLGRIEMKLDPIDDLPRWSTVSPVLFDDIRDRLHTALGDTDVVINKEDIGQVMNEWAKVRERVSGVRSRVASQFPTSVEALSDPDLWTRLQRNAIGSDQLPLVFRVETPQGVAVFRNDPELGVLPQRLTGAEDTPTSLIVPSQFDTDPIPEGMQIDPEPTRRQGESKAEFDSRFAVWENTHFKLNTGEGRSGSFVPVTPVTPVTPTAPTMSVSVGEGADLILQQRAAERQASIASPEGLPAVGTPQQVQDRPDFDPQDRFGTQTISQEILSLILRPENLTGGPPEEEPKGGGPPRLVFDRVHAAENLRSQWRDLLLEEPNNPDGMVTEYENSANNLLRAGGATPNFETWVLNKIRATSRYGVLYGNKGEAQSETEYIDSFRQGVSPFGLNPRIEKRELERGLSTGAAPAAFQQSVAFGRDVQALNPGSFSRRFAASLNKLGRLQDA